MKYFIKWVAFFAIVIILIPLILKYVFFRGMQGTTEDSKGYMVRVLLTDTNEVIELDSEEYVLGALIAEMPAEFETEALKAQSVAIRTYLFEKIKSGKETDEHKGAVICDDATHCQAYCSPDDIKQKWQKNESFYYKKCKNAVKETYGKIACYEGKPINAVFHAYSHGRTENAQDVWGTKVDYLVSVESPGDVILPKLNSTFQISIAEFKEIMKEKFDCNFDEVFIGNITRTSGGSVENIIIGDKSVKGTDFRKTFNLKSACFNVKTNEDSVLMDVKGYGHGVGMSQYGANYYALQGLKYDEILKKYYTGISIENTSADNE